MTLAHLNSNSLEDFTASCNYLAWIKNMKSYKSLRNLLSGSYNNIGYSHFWILCFISIDSYGYYIFVLWKHIFFSSNIRLVYAIFIKFKLCHLNSSWFLLPNLSYRNRRFLNAETSLLLFFYNIIFSDYIKKEGEFLLDLI